FFFFQAEDGIRDRNVTGVQTCALPISNCSVNEYLEVYFADIEIMEAYIDVESNYSLTEQFVALVMAIMTLIGVIPVVMTILKLRSEERRVGKESVCGCGRKE